MHVRVDEAWRHRAAAEIDHLRGGAGARLDLRASSRPRRCGRRDGDRLRNRVARVDGDDLAVHEHEVGRRSPGRAARPAAGQAATSSASASPIVGLASRGYPTARMAGAVSIARPGMDEHALAGQAAAGASNRNRIPRLGRAGQPWRFVPCSTALHSSSSVFGGSSSARENCVSPPPAARWLAALAGLGAVAAAASPISAAPRRLTGARPARPHRACAPPWSACCSSACSGRRWCSAPPCRTRTSSACCSTTRAACASPTWTASRAAPFVQEQFGAADRGLRGRSAERFTVRTFRFSSARVGARPPGERPDLRRHAAPGSAAALDRRAPGAGRACRSPGSSWSATAPTPAAARSSRRCWRSRPPGVPVFTVGVGRERADRDVQVGRVAAPRTVAGSGTTLMVDVLVTSPATPASGHARRDDDGRIVGIAAGHAAADGQPATVRGPLHAPSRAARVHASASRRSRASCVTENNAREALIDVRDRREKILYFEGEPRFEVKFLRRAVADDKQPAAGRAAAHRRQQVPAARASTTPTSSSAASRRRARSCSVPRRSCWAASRPAPSPATSCG